MWTEKKRVVNWSPALRISLSQTLAVKRPRKANDPSHQETLLIQNLPLGRLDIKVQHTTRQEEMQTSVEQLDSMFINIKA